jgi:hypothetical protein
MAGWEKNLHRHGQISGCWGWERRKGGRRHVVFGRDLTVTVPRNLGRVKCPGSPLTSHQFRESELAGK